MFLPTLCAMTLAHVAVLGGDNFNIPQVAVIYPNGDVAAVHLHVWEGVEPF